MKQHKVLIVDDEPMIRWAMARALTDWGYDPSEAESVSAARDLFDRAQPDFVLLDLNLPDGSGLQLLRRFKRMRPDVAVIIVSGDVVVENTIQALRGGADDFISKPIDLRELRLALDGRGAANKDPRPASGKVRVLLVTDTEEPLRPLDAVLSEADFEIDRARTQEEFDAACAKTHDLAIVNQDAAQLKITLPKLRRSSAHTQIPVLVSALRIEDDPNLAGLLPRYRAMACSPMELRTLMERRRRARQEMQAARNLL